MCECEGVRVDVGDVFVDARMCVYGCEGVCVDVRVCVWM